MAAAPLWRGCSWPWSRLISSRMARWLSPKRSKAILKPTELEDDDRLGNPKPKIRNKVKIAMLLLNQPPAGRQFEILTFSRWVLFRVFAFSVRIL
jgi:hypothetical protein